MAHFFYTYGSHCYSQKNYSEAIQNYSAALKFAPNHCWTLHRLGNCYLVTKKYEKAKNFYLQATNTDNPPLFSYYNLGCIYALQNDKKNALIYLEKTIQKGYTKLEKLEVDSDWSSIRTENKYQQIIQDAKKIKTQHSLIEEYQNSGYQNKMRILQESISKNFPKKLDLAILTLNETYEGYRVASIALLSSLSPKESSEYLIVALFDANGYVKKAAANAIVKSAINVQQQLISILQKPNSPATPYVIQILGHINSTNSIDILIPYLKDEDPFICISTVDSLVRLKAISAIPVLEQISQQMKNAKTPQKEFYQIKIQHAISYLQKLKHK
ncbi:TPR end-of-group domain-containing protein [Candidatus Uabimicrobium amorphum]